MTITRRYILFTSLGILLTLAAWLIGLHGFVFVFWLILSIGLLILDIVLTPSATCLTAQRTQEQKIYFKTQNTIIFDVRNQGKTPLTVEARDESLRHFKVVAAPEAHTISPKHTQTFTYEVLPGKRGSFQANKIYLRYKGLLGFCIKHTAIHCPTNYKVYPNIKDLSKYRLLMQKSRLLPRGEKHIRQYGTGTDFESLRQYVEGDDYRKINWPATARENKLMLNQYQIERDQPVYILLDIARPMSYSVNGYKKLDYAINAAIVLCDIVNQQGDKAGLMVFDTQVQTHISPGQGPLHRSNLLEALYHVEDNRQTANYRNAFQTLSQKQKRRSLVFIFTDFEILEEAEELIANITILKRRHLPIVVFMANESLAAMANEPDTPTPYSKLLKETAQEFYTERRTIIRKLNAMGIPSVESTAEEFAVSAVNRYLQATRA